MEVDLSNPVVNKLVEEGAKGKAKPGQAGEAKAGVHGNTKLGKEDFMKILMAQIKNQDPFNPMDTKEYGTHLAQFSQLEQLMNVNQNLEKMGTTQGVTNKNELVAYIGKEIHAKNDSFELKKGMEVTLPFTLSGDAENVQVEVYDAKGEAVAVIDAGKMAKGDGRVSFKGLNKDGIQLGDGKYSFRIVAKDFFGSDVGADTALKGKVTGVSFENGKTQLMVGSLAVDPANVTKVMMQTTQ
jgi:flagellar basal-body rod modification protein FlgD